MCIHGSIRTSSRTGRRTNRNHCKGRVATDGRRCFCEAGTKPRSQITAVSLAIPGARGQRRSFFWLEEENDSLDFQVFQRSLKNAVVGWSPALGVGSHTHLASTRGKPALLLLELGRGLAPITVAGPHAFWLSTHS